MTGQTITPSIEVDARDRTFRLYAPARLPASDGVPLVVVLHRGVRSVAQAEKT